jgi:hypothetical protein
VQARRAKCNPRGDSGTLSRARRATQLVEKAGRKLRMLRSKRGA